MSRWTRAGVFALSIAPVCSAPYPQSVAAWRQHRLGDRDDLGGRRQYVRDGLINDRIGMFRPPIPRAKASGMIPTNATMITRPTGAILAKVAEGEARGRADEGARWVADEDAPGSVKSRCLAPDLPNTSTSAAAEHLPSSDEPGGPRVSGS